jgi:translocation and assembly module TamA
LLWIGLAATQAAGEVTFDGLDEALERNARALVRLASTPCDRPRWRIERLFRNADEELRGALEALGYYDFSLDKSLSFADPECWSATFNVELGAPVILDDVRLALTGEVQSYPDIVERIDGRRPEIGSVLNHGVYEAFKRAMLTELSNRGFLDAELTHSTAIVSADLATAVIDIEAESGTRYRFGELTFTEGILDTDILGSFATFSAGEYYDSDAIASLHKQLRGSGFFASVTIGAEPAAGSLDVPVDVTLYPAKRHQFRGGAGYSTDYGPRLSMGYANRRLNSAGHRIDAELLVSPVDSEVTTTYRWPHVGSPLSWFEVYAGYQQRRTDTSESDKTTVGARWVRNRTERWLETPYIDLTYEDSLVAGQRDQSTLLIPGIKWEAAVGRALGRIESGWRASVDLRGSYKALASDATFGQVTTAAKYVHAMGEQYRLILRGELGTTFGDDVRDLPATVRFFTGGDTSVRGYDYESIGPLNDEGEVIGGSNLTTLSLEIERMVAESWAVAVFADSGSAFSDSDIDFKTGVGFGVRWFSPLGPIRLDMAHPLDDDETNVRFHLTLGPDL